MGLLTVFSAGPEGDFTNQLYEVLRDYWSYDRNNIILNYRHDSWYF